MHTHTHERAAIEANLKRKRNISSSDRKQTERFKQRNEQKSDKRWTKHSHIPVHYLYVCVYTSMHIQIIDEYENEINIHRDSFFDILQWTLKLADHPLKNRAIWHAHCVQIKLNNSIMLCGPHFYPIPCPNCASHAIPNNSVLHSVHELTTCQHIQKTLSQNLIKIVYTSMT